MKNFLGAALLLACPAWAGYTYYLTDNLASIDAAKWVATGAMSPSQTGLSATDAGGATLISRLPIPDGSSEAEVAMTITLLASGGTYTEFLQATSDARTAHSRAGSYLAFEMQNPKFDSSAKCTATYVLFQSTTRPGRRSPFPPTNRSPPPMRILPRFSRSITPRPGRPPPPSP